MDWNMLEAFLHFVGEQYPMLMNSSHYGLWHYNHRPNRSRWQLTDDGRQFYLRLKHERENRVTPDVPPGKGLIANG
jgi:hypothetical protein